jgi:hypothetical protein
MKRLIDRQLTEWKNHLRRKPLVIRGARQIGKTWSVKAFGKKHFEHTLFVDFERNKEFRDIFTRNFEPARICRELELLSNVPLVAGKTLVFFDEIQECPEALISLRYFYEEMPELHLIATGSLLEFAFAEISFPVGRVQFLNMLPMGFIEFLHANGHLALVKLLIANQEPISETIHEKLLELLRSYFLVGGMPEAVKTFAETNSYRNVFEVHAEITHAYTLDFGKYQPRVDKNCLTTVFANLGKLVGKQTKYTALADDYSGPTIKKAYNALQMAKIISQVPSVNPVGFPLEANSSAKIFKTLMVDIGIMHHISGLKFSHENAFADLLQLYNGAMAEQYAGQELLLANGENICYWKREAKSSNAELDYIAVVHDAIFPVEVKSVAAGRLRSMHLFLERYPTTQYGIVSSTQMRSELPEAKLKFVPLYDLFVFTNSKYDMQDFLS